MLDNVTIEIMWKRLVSILDESAVNMMRTSFSSIIRDFHDFAIGFADSKGRVVAQAVPGTPGLAGVLVNGIRSFIRMFPEENLFPGDVLITNDPWLVSGHNMDITICRPIFYHDKLVGYNLNDAHHLDMGGRMGSYECRDAYEEGLRIPPLKVHKACVPNEDVFAFIRNNVRVADKVIGDIRAQIAAAYFVDKRVTELIDELGLEDFENLIDEILDRSEANMRSCIAKIPSGKYRSVVPLDSIEVDGEIPKIVLTINVDGDEIVCDFEGTSPQVELAVNSILEALTWCYAYTGLKSLFNPDVPNNAGGFRPITIRAPKGSILNAEFPAPTTGRVCITYFIPEAVFMALKDVVPAKVIAGSGSIPLTYFLFNGKTWDGKEFLVPIALGGGIGGTKNSDGVSTITFPGNVANIPVEITESEAPILYRKKEYIADSAGPGEHRGGIGQEVEVSIYYPEGTKDMTQEVPVVVMPMGGRFRYEISGIHGGRGANPMEILINDKNIISGKHVWLRSGDRVTIRLPGGGGNGSPLLRDVNAVFEDVRNGVVSKEAAVQHYGVVMDENGKVDKEETDDLRRRLSAKETT